MALDVKVKIELSKSVGSVGFGIPLLVQSGVEAQVAYTECYSLEDVVAAGFKADSDMYKAANAVFAQENKPSKIAVYAHTGTLTEAITAVIAKDFRQIVVVNGETDEYIAAADYVEATQKMLFLSVTNADWATFKASLEGKKYNRTVIFVNDTAYANAALVGEMAGRTVGSYTYKFKTLKGVVAETYTEAEIKAFHDAGAIVYVTKAGDDQTSEGIAQSGVYIDETENMDYVIQNIEYRVQKVFNTTAKVSYDDKGIALIESAVETALKEAAVNGVIAQLEDGTYDYSVAFGARSATTEADRASRVYNYGSFKFSLAGAIHYATIYGEISK